jgi:DNA polymerase V
MDLGGCASSEPFALQVTDNSMEPEFKRGCIIVIDPAGVIEHGCYVLAVVENGYIFRQLVKEGERYFLQPLHEDYLHERREIELDAIQGVIVQQAGTTGKRADRKRYTSI